MSTHLLSRAGVLGLAAMMVGGFAGASAAPLPNCAVPVLSADAFAAGDTNTVTWTQPDDASEGGGFILEVASSPTRDLDGSLFDVEQTIGSLAASDRSFTLSGLSESAHWYSIKAKTKPQSCQASGWSAADISTIQDATGPVVTILSPDEGHIYLLETVTVSGIVTDDGSGPATVTVAMTNTTPVVGEIVGAPESITVDASDGTFSATFTGVLPGTYEFSASAVDNVGNESSESATRGVIVTVAG
ncbi:MAG TPA: hypothetical protein VGB64_12110 [Actinomycetota bacterium]